MTTQTQTIDETRIAQQIIAALPESSVTRLISDDRDTICYAVADSSLKLKTITFSRKSLRKLAQDPACTVKIDYLQRDILRSSTRRAAFRYPRESRIVTVIRGRRVKITRLAVAL